MYINEEYEVPIDWNDALDPDPYEPEPLPVVDDEWVNPYDPEPPATIDPNNPDVDTTPPATDPDEVYNPRNPDGSVTNADGSRTYTDPDDGSTLTVDKDGNPISATTSIATGSKPATERDPATGQIRVSAAGKENPGGWLQSLQKFAGAKETKDVTKFLKEAFATKDGKVSPVAPAIGAIIGMLNRTKGDEGTRGLKEAPTPYVANRQQITQPIGAATGQGQQYFSPTTYTKTPEPQNLPVKTTGGGLEGLRPQPTPTGFPLGYDPNAPQPTPFPPYRGRGDDMILPPKEPEGGIRTAVMPNDWNGPVDESGRPINPMYDSTNSTSTADFNKENPYAGAMNEGMSKLFSMGNSTPYVPKPSGPNDPQYAEGGLASIPMQDPVSMYAYGGLSNLGGYTHAAGGRMLKGPGDGMSDSIPASIAGKQPARLATDEFVIPADVVSHLGNGSSDAGAKVLYDMMARVRKARTGKAMQGKKINPQKLMPR